MQDNLTQIAQQVVASAVKGGADGAECVIREGQGFSTTVRMGEVEQLKEAGSKALGLRVLVARRCSSSYTSDFSAGGLDRAVNTALAMARLTSEDPYAGLPEPSVLGVARGDLSLYFDDVHALSTADRIAMARRAEQAALSHDPRIRNSEGASFQAREGSMILANSLGFAGEYRTSSVSLSVEPVAAESESGSAGMVRDYWFSAARSLAGLEDAESVGRMAAERALRRLGARKIPTCRVPVIFEPRTAKTLLSHLFDAVSGDAVYRQSTYLAGKLGEAVASGAVSVWDDGTRPGGFGTSPFDDEGVPTRRTPVIESGVLRSYLLNCYAGRKLGLATTGNASRGLSGNPGIGYGNFYLQPGPHSPEAIIKSVTRGFLVTELLGFGVNLVTGDYSRGAAGFWIENGEIAYPVHEVTIAGHLLEMWKHIEMIGDDLVFRGPVASPTLKISEMTVAGT